MLSDSCSAQQNPVIIIIFLLNITDISLLVNSKHMARLYCGLVKVTNLKIIELTGADWSRPTGIKLLPGLQMASRPSNYNKGRLRLPPSHLSLLGFMFLMRIFSIDSGEVEVLCYVVCIVCIVVS